MNEEKEEIEKPKVRVFLWGFTASGNTLSEANEKLFNQIEEHYT